MWKRRQLRAQGNLNQDDAIPLLPPQKAGDEQTEVETGVNPSSYSCSQRIQQLNLYGLPEQQELETRLDQHQLHLPQGDLEQDEEARTREKREKVPILR